MCCCQGATGAMLLVRRNCGAAVLRTTVVAFGSAELRMLRNFGASLAIADCRRLAQHPCRFSSGPRVGLQLRPAVLRSTDGIKADGGDGGGDLRGESVERPMFPGRSVRNLARDRSWPAAELGGWRAMCSWLAAADRTWGGRSSRALSGRNWRELPKMVERPAAAKADLAEADFTELARWAA